MFTNKKFQVRKSGELMTPAPGYTMAQQRAAAGDRALAMREAYSNGIRCKGFTLAVTATATSSSSIDLSGMAKNFLGFAFFSTAAIPAIIGQLVINNDVVVDGVNLNHFLVNLQTSDRDYFAFPRPLNGQDTITFNFTNPGALTTLFLNVYYI